MPNLTERRIRDLVPLAGRPRTIWDDKQRGFGVRVTSGGTRSFVIRYTGTDGKRHLSVIASCAEMSLKDARTRAGEMLRAVRDGEAGPIERRRELRTAPTVADLMARFLDVHCPQQIANGRMVETTCYQYRLQAAKYILPDLADRAVKAVTRADVEAVVDPLPGPSRNRVLALMSRTFNLAEGWEWRPTGTNPCQHVERARETARDRVLTMDEIGRLADALDKVASPVANAAIRFMLLTAWRFGECKALRYEDVDLSTGVVVLAHTKVGRQTRVLGAEALDLVKAQEKRPFNPHVFPGRNGNGISHPRLHKVLKAAADRAGLADVRLHDLRRSTATHAAASGLNAHLLKGLLGHKTTRMAERYVHLSHVALKSTVDETTARMAGMMKR